MLSQFDPDKGPLLKGETISFTVVDPAIPGHVPNRVIDGSKPVQAIWKQKWSGSDLPLYVASLNPRSVGSLFVNAIGPGPSKRVAQDSISIGPVTGTTLEITHTFTIPANSLPEEDPGQSPTGPSGIYKLVATSFIDSTLGAPGFDMTGFHEGDVIKVENPL